MAEWLRLFIYYWSHCLSALRLGVRISLWVGQGVLNCNLNSQGLPVFLPKFEGFLRILFIIWKMSQSGKLQWNLMFQLLTAKICILNCYCDWKEKLKFLCSWCVVQHNAFCIVHYWFHSVIQVQHTIIEHMFSGWVVLSLWWLFLTFHAKTNYMFVYFLNFTLYFIQRLKSFIISSHFNFMSFIYSLFLPSNQ